MTIPIQICVTVGSNGRIMAFRKHKVCPSGMLQTTGKKEDVTDQVNAIIRQQVFRLVGTSALYNALVEGLEIR